MFFLTELSQTLNLSPNDFTSSLSKTLQSLLFSSVEGTCSSQHGFIITVKQITNINGGRLSHTGHAIFNVHYEALLLRPVKNEVLDCIVVDVNNLGIFCEVGPLSVFVSNHHIPKSFLNSGMIVKDKAVRVRIIGTKIDTKRIYAIGSIDGDCLGLIETYKEDIE
ncbi:DNA-directed RNA polymerase II subunit RPB7 [Gurleya vavrai]